MRLSLLAPALYVIPLALQAAITVLMIRRGLFKAFPIFFAYTVLVPSRDLVLLLLLPNSGNRYASVFWWGDAIAILLSIGVVIEVLRHLFRPYPFLRFIFRGVWVVAVIATTSALALFHNSSLKGADKLLESIILMERSARILQVFLLIFLISVTSRLGLTWQNYSLGIAAGFGVYSALDLALLQFRGYLHDLSDSTFALLGSAAYNLAVIIWTFYFLKPHPETTLSSLPNTDLASWNDALSEQVDKWHKH